MTPTPPIVRTALAAVLAAGLAAALPPAPAGAQAPPTALILTEVDGTGDALVAANNVAGILALRGLLPEVRTVNPGDDIGDLAAYACVWDVRYVSALSASDVTRLTAYAQGGTGGIYLNGENGGFAPRNDSVTGLIGALGGGAPTVDPTLPINTVPTDILELLNPAHAVASECATAVIADYDGVANGQFLSFGTGTWLSGSAAMGGAAAWDQGTLALAPGANVIAVLDINWLLDDSRPNGTLDHKVTDRTIATENRVIADNIARAVCRFCCATGLHLAPPLDPRSPLSPASPSSACSAASSS